MKPSMKLRGAIILCLCVCFGDQPVVGQSTATPPTAVDTRDFKTQYPLIQPHLLVGESKAVWTELQGCLTELARTALPASTDKASSKQLATGYVNYRKLSRLVERMRQFGEPVAVDANLQGNFYSSPILYSLERYLATPKGRTDAQKAMAYVTRTAPARAKIIGQIQQLISKGSFEQAEAMLDKTYDDLFLFLAYIHHYEHKNILEPFSVVQSYIHDAMQKKRISATQTTFANVFAEATNQRDQLLAILEQGRLELSRGDSVTIDGQAMPAPQALATVLSRWELVHSAMVHAEAIEAASRATGYDGASSHSGEQSTWYRETTQLTSSVQQLVSAWITTQSQSTQPDVAKNHYLAYVQTLASVAPHVRDPQWVNAFEAPLASLAARAGLTPSVTAYTKATDGVLRWRAKIADAQAKKHAANFPEASDYSRMQLPFDQTGKGFFLNQPNAPSPPIPCNYVAIPNSLPWATERIMNRPVTLNNSFHLPGEKKIWMSRYRQGVYARLVTIPGLENMPAIAKLRSDLLVDTDHPPLSLRSAMAIGTAERGEFRKVGGTILHMTLEGSVSRFATLPPMAGKLFMYGDVPLRVDYGDELSGLAIRYDVQPAWLSHDYFFQVISP